MFKKQPKSWFFEKIHTSDKTPARLIRGEKEWRKHKLSITALR